MVSAADYDQLKAWLSFMFELPEIGLPTVTPDMHPIAILGQMEKSAPARARQGLRMAIGDVLEMTADMRLSDLKLVDENCRAKGLPTLSEMRARFSKNLKAVVRRGHIRTETEYHLVRGALEFTPSEHERATLQGLLDAFER